MLAGRARAVVPWVLAGIVVAVSTPSGVSAQSMYVGDARGDVPPALFLGGSPGGGTVALDELQEILVDLRIGRFARRTVRALTDGAEVLLPVEDLLTLGEVDHRVEPEGSIQAILHPGARRLVFDPAAGEVFQAGARWTVPGGALVVDDGALYAAAPVLGRALGVTLHVDWVQLAVVVMDPEVLPLGRRLAREARWRSLRGDGDGNGDPFAPRVDLAHGPLGGGVLDWSLSAEATDPEATTAYAVGAGIRAFGGGLQASSRSLGPVSLGEHQMDVTYLKVWPDRPGLTQMRLGDAYTTGPRLRGVRGVALTNAPFLRRNFFGTDSFRGRVGPGWDVEVRQSGQTLDLTRADEQGAFALDIPLRYGENSVQVVAFGPHGEVVTTDRLFLLGSERLPPGAVEWGVSGGECRDPRCDLGGNADLRLGVTSRWTVRMGTEVFARADLASLVQPYVGATGLVLPSLELSSEFLHDGFARGGLTFAPSSRFRVRGAYTAFVTGVPEPLLHDARRTGTTEADAFLRPWASRPRWLVRGALLHQDFTFGSLTSLQASTLFQLGHVGVEAGIRRQVDAPVLGVRRASDFQVGSVTGLVTSPYGQKVWFRGEVETMGGTVLNRIRGQLGHQLTPGTRFEIGSGWQKGMGGDLTFTVSAYLSQLRSLTQMVVPDESATRLTQVAQGTVQWNEATRQIELSPGPGLERGGISGYVFLDENGNGVRDPGEAGLEGVRLVIGGRTVRTDVDGRHHTWDLVPFETVRVWADSGSIADPTLVPVRDQVEVRVPPSSFGRVDIPITPSQELWGSVVRVTGSGEVRVPHAELELVDLDTGVVRPLRAFSDGDFYESGVKPGRYELRVVAGSLAGLGVVPEAAAIPLDVRAGPGSNAQGGIVVRLVAASEAGGGDAR